MKKGKSLIRKKLKGNTVMGVMDKEKEKGQLYMKEERQNKKKIERCNRKIVMNGK